MAITDRIAETNLSVSSRKISMKMSKWAGRRKQTGVQVAYSHVHPVH